MIRKTERLKAIASVIPGLCHPGIVAKVAATIDFATNGRFCLNVMNGCFKDEFIEQRYLRCQEFINVLKGMWTEDEFHFLLNFYQIHSSRKKPQFIKRSHPEIFLRGNSKAARSLAVRVSDWYFLNGNTVEGVRQQIAEVSVLTRQQGRKVKLGFNAFVIVRDTEAEAHAVLEEMIAQADVNPVKYVGISKRNHRRRISANSDLSCLTQYHDGFKTGLIGTVEQVAEKIRQYNEVGVEMILCSFLNYTDDLPAFGRTVIPLVREIETRNHLTQELFVA
ncbi:MAG: LLM class flavin-dependent oxidoreductase [Heteroscytonema crispum UTEX LB 1556]